MKFFLYHNDIIIDYKNDPGLEWGSHELIS